MLALVSLGDGYDYTAMAFAAPAVIKDMHIARGAMGSVFGAGLFGIMLGSMAFGYIGDQQLFLVAASPLVVVLLSCVTLGWVYLTRFAKDEAVALQGAAVIAD